MIVLRVTKAFFGISPALVYLVAGLQGTHGDLSAGTLVAFTTLQSRLLLPINQLLQVSVDVQSSLALFGRIFELIDLRPRITDRPDAIDLDAGEIRGEVAFEDVWFRYGGGEDSGPPAPEEALRDVSMLVSPGQLAALVGPSGAGKTTISYLIPRLYDVEDGAVKIDGHDVRDLSAATIARAVGVVTQESYLFGGTVRENISYGRPNATDEEIVAAAKAAFIHDRILALEHGYDTVVGERGYRFSGGERQRLAIARVILEDPPILVLDEATSALDTESERIVQQALESLIQRRTTIAIAHRLSTIRNADVIFAIDHGTIVERGTHNELLARGGLYARLYEEQFGDGVVEAHCSDGVILANGRPCRPSSQRPQPDGRLPAPVTAEPAPSMIEVPAELRTVLLPDCGRLPSSRAPPGRARLPVGYRDTRSRRAVACRTMWTWVTSTCVLRSETNRSGSSRPSDRQRITGRWRRRNTLSPICSNGWLMSSRWTRPMIVAAF